MEIEADGKWRRYRIRHLQPDQVVEVRRRVEGVTLVEDIVLSTIPLEIIDLGVERRYPWYK